MRLIELKLRNFRGYKEETCISINDLTTFVGKNDAGKSTILEALEIFFNNKVVVCEKEDLSVNHDEGDEIIEITCIFDKYLESISIDSSALTTLSSEFLLNKDKNLEIKKIFKATSSKPKANTFIVCNHPSNDKFNDLLTLKITDLRKRANELGIAVDQYDARSSVSIRKAIWSKCKKLDLLEIEIPVDKEDSKKIYEKLEGYLPHYALFQSDRSSSDSDKEVTDPMKIAIQKALKEVSIELEKIKEEVKKKAIETANKTLDKLKDMNSELACSLNPEFKSEPNFDSVFKLTITSDDDIPMNKRGSGVRRLLLLNFFRAEAARQLNDADRNNSIIYAFEEPETAQHPSHQKMLVESFIKISRKLNTQVIMTTHTPAICGVVPIESLRLVDKKDNINVVRENSDDVYQKISEMLGILPEFISNSVKGLVLVEGKDDIIFLKHTAKELKNRGFIDYTFEEKNIAILPIGGCRNLRHWLAQKIAEQFSIPWGILLDSDKLKSNVRSNNEEEINKLMGEGIKAYATRKRELENYIDIACISDDTSITGFDDFEDVKETIKEAVPEIGKKVLEKCWEKMTADQIRNSEKYIDETGKERYEFTEMINDFLSMVD